MNEKGGKYEAFVSETAYGVMENESDIFFVIGYESITHFVGRRRQAGMHACAQGSDGLYEDIRDVSSAEQ